VIKGPFASNRFGSSSFLLIGVCQDGTAIAMSARLLTDAICDLSLPPARATDHEIRTLLADSELGDDWYDCADCNR